MVENLRKMDELKQSVQLAVHEQKDPLLIYKFEAFNLFNGMLNGVNKEVVLIQREPQQSAPDISEVEVREKEDYKLSKTKFQIVKVQIVKLVKHNNDKLLKLLKRYAKDKP
jgi:preprotein translocase subunit SecA